MGGRGGSSGMGGARSSNLAHIEDKIRRNTTETAALIGPNGDVIFDKSDGLSNAVYFSADECAKMVDGTLTHNHPRGTTFSGEDVSLATSRGLREIRAVHENGYYSLTRNYNVGDQVPSHYTKFASHYEGAVSKYMKTTVDAIYNSTGDAVRCNSMVADFRRRWLKSNSSRYGWTYKEG